MIAVFQQGDNGKRDLPTKRVGWKWGETQKGEEQYQERVTVPVTKTKECAGKAEVKASSSKETLWLLLAGPLPVQVPAMRACTPGEVGLCGTNPAEFGVHLPGELFPLAALPSAKSAFCVPPPRGWEGSFASASPSP